ncbi:Ncs2 protein [Martiniozyma asiatica (nom. inval.)]|nr:Ncs2 protein [Martiniozyma asiatica]
MSTTHKSIGTPCKRCSKEPTVVFSRNDNFCHYCFVRFIRGKQRRQMMDDRFKVKFNPNIIQTPVAFDFKLDDYSSIVLFDILIDLLTEQSNMGPKARVGFLLTVCIVKDSPYGSEPLELIEKLETKYGKELLNRLNIKFSIINPNNYSLNRQIESIHLNSNYNTVISSTESDCTLSFKELISQTKDKSTREDLENIIHSQMIQRYLLSNNITTLLDSSSMTSLSVKILSTTIKGRGSEVASVVSDGQLTYKGFAYDIIHPLREVLHSELRVYAEQEGIDLMLIEDARAIVKPEAKSAKNKTVDELVSEYFQTIEIEYPEVVSTVEKIGGKLDGLKCEKSECPVCGKEVHDDAKQWLEQITVKGHAPVIEEEDKANFQRWANFNLENLSSDLEGSLIKLCYGCLVTLGAGETTTLKWPKRMSKQDILDEYILTDNEE